MSSTVDKDSRLQNSRGGGALDIYGGRRESQKVRTREALSSLVLVSQFHFLVRSRLFLHKWCAFVRMTLKNSVCLSGYKNSNLLRRAHKSQFERTQKTTREGT